MDVTEQKRTLVKHLVNVIGGEPKFYTCGDEQGTSTIHVLCIENAPLEGVHFYSTVGTMEYSSGYTSDGVPLRVELLGTCDAREDTFPEILATCAFCIINSNFKIFPGEIFYNVVGMFHSTIDMKHIMFVPPFLWEDELETIRFDDKWVDWLLAIPISENECLYAERHGTDALEELFEKEQIDIFNLQRKSIL